MSQILKTFYAGGSVYQVLYDNIRINADDPREVQRLKRSIRQSVRRLIRSKRLCIELLVRQNFDRRAYYCTLTFDAGTLPPDKIKANGRFAYFLRRLRDLGNHNVRYIKVLEHKHGAGRWHFHCIISGASRRAIKQAWEGTYGMAAISRLDPQKITKLSTYMAKEATDEVGKRTYSRSRGSCRLQDPEVTVDIVDDNYTLMLPQGAELIERAVICSNAYGQSEFLFFQAPSAKGHRKPKGERGI